MKKNKKKKKKRLRKLNNVIFFKNKSSILLSTLFFYQISPIPSAFQTQYSVLYKRVGAGVGGECGEGEG